MTRDDAIIQLKAHADSVRDMGATSLYLFGSTARDDARPDSDLVLFIDYDPESRFNGLDLVGIQLFLEEQRGTDVDATTRDSLHPRLRARIEQSAIRIF